jgi:predicted MFS family arabinose efflux permease
VRYAAGTPRLRLAIGLVFVVSLCVFNFSVYVPLLARDVLGLGAEGFGFLMASLGVGAVGGALTVGARASRFPSVRSMLVAAALALGMLSALGFIRRIELAVPLLFLTGYWGIMLMASCNTSIQLQAPDALRGRVMSIYTWVSGGVFPIGAFVVGSISEGWGVSTAFVFNGTLGLAAVAALALWWQWRRG